MFIPFNRDLAKELLAWEYPREYDFYNMDLVEENIEELLDNDYYGYIDNEGNLIGFAAFGDCAKTPSAYSYPDGYLDISLGLRPSYCGKNFGPKFLDSILNFAKNNYETRKYRLTVSSTNKRAISAYRKGGFKIAETIYQRFTGLEFLIMVKE